MKGEGQQVHGGEHHGEVLFAVPEIMFEVVAVIFQDVEGLILDFPSGSGAVGDLGDIGFVDWQIGDEGALIGDLALGVGDGQSDPVDQKGLFAVPQGNLVEPLQVMPAQLAAQDFTAGVLLGGGPGDEIIEGFVGGGLGGEQEVATGLVSRLSIDDQ